MRRWPALLLGLALVAGPLTAPPAAAGPGGADWWATANIGRHATPDVRKAAIGRVRERFGRAPIIGWQEIDESDTGREHRWLRNRLPRYSWAGWDGPIPIAVPPRYKIRHQRTTVATRGGIPGYHPKPWRITEAVIRPVTGGKRTAVLNVHFVSGAFSSPGQRAETRRVRLWWQNWATLRHRVQHYRSLGYRVIVMGDFNRRRLPQLAPRARILTRHRIDYVLAIPGHRAPRPHRLVIPLGIDGHSATATRIRR